VAWVPDANCSFRMIGGVPVATAPAEIDVTAGQSREMLVPWGRPQEHHAGGGGDLSSLDGVIPHFAGLQEALARMSDGRVRLRGPDPLPECAAAPDGQSAPVRAVTHNGGHCEDRGQWFASLGPPGGIFTMELSSCCRI
jgi:hypothetical protein